MTTTKLEVFNTGRVPASLPFCSAIRAGDMIFVSGCIGHPHGQQKVVEGGVAAEAEQALQHMRASLEAAGSSLEQVAKCLVFLTDMADFELMNEVYSAFFGSHRPARSTVAVAELALAAKFEIECVALAG
jgi:reactive intermediate/imine deaminase